MNEAKSQNGSLGCLLLVGLENSVIEFVKSFLKETNLLIMTGEEVIQLIDSPMETQPTACLVGPNLKEPGALEIAQTLRMFWPDKPLFFASENRRDYEIQAFVKNGFKDTFSLVVDTVALKSALVGVVGQGSNQKAFKSVKLVDIQPNAVLAFDTAVYLPANDKYVTFSRSSEALSAEQVGRLRANKISSVFVPVAQMPKFYEHTSKVLQGLGKSSELSETERRDRLHSAVRGLLAGAMGDSSKEGVFSSGKDIMTDCSKIVESFVLNSPSKSIYSRIQLIVGDQPDHYSHTANTSTLAALFSIGLGLGNPEHLAVAGLLHDLGLASVPLEVQRKAEKDRTPAEKQIYQKHVAGSIEMAKAQKLILPDAVLKAILQHHEKLNGTGYPNGIVGSKMTIEAQILAIADRFEELTSLEAGKARLSPIEAIKFFTQEVAQDLGKLWYDPKLMSKILGLMSTE